MIDTEIRHHLVIAGTGRAGTSFLVRYLDALGLDTHLGRHKEACWDENANAGLEDELTNGSPGERPYVCKSPWLYQVIDQVLADPAIKIDAVVLPMRNLAEAAASRSILELRSIYEHHHNMAKLDHAWSEWGNVPGGSIYSLEPLDQARLLACGFYNLLERLVERRIPILLLHFPRSVEDPAYLFQTLRPVLPAGTTEAAAQAAYDQIADGGKVRVGGELSSPVGKVQSFPTHTAVDTVAVRRELQRSQAEIVKSRTEMAALRSGHDETLRELQYRYNLRDRDFQRLAQSFAALESDFKRLKQKPSKRLRLFIGRVMQQAIQRVRTIGRAPGSVPVSGTVLAHK